MRDSVSPPEARHLKASGRLLDLLTIAEQVARPGISGFCVGAAAVGASGAIYFGANLEFPGAGLLYTVHAEQAAVLNARIHGESHINQLAVSAPPCGRCRQFLNELERGADIDIVTKVAEPSRLVEWLPNPFGPADLNIEAGFFTPHDNPIAAPTEPLDDLAEQAFEAARRCYAPYTAAYAAIALQFPDGSAVTGPYIENAAFHPSLLPLQSALVDMALHGLKAADIRTAVLIQAASELVDHEASTRELLATVAPRANLTVITLRAER